MTKEELEKKATAYALKWGDKTDGTYACCRDGYLASAKPREKRIEDLESQIEKMKCCPNCDFIFRDGNCYYDKECKNKDHWKLRR